MSLNRKSTVGNEDFYFCRTQDLCVRTLLCFSSKRCTTNHCKASEQRMWLPAHGTNKQRNTFGQGYPS